jgi:hypothetical protein
MTAAYGPYAASATGGNDLARDFLAGIAALYSTPSKLSFIVRYIPLTVFSVYTNIPGRPLEYASTILACLAFVVTVPIYVFYKKGPQIRAKSKFAQSLDVSRKKKHVQSGNVAEKSVAGSDKEKESLKQV